MATSNNRDVKLAVEIQAAGEENLLRLANEVRALAKAGDDAAPKYLELATEIERVAAQARELSAFKTAAEGIDEATAATKRAVAEADRLTTEYKQQAQATETVRQAQAKIRAELDNTKLGIAEQVFQQRLLKEQYKEGKVDADAYALGIAQLDTKIAALKKGQVELNSELGRSKIATRNAERDLSTLAAASLKASESAQTLQNALRTQVGAMESARAAGERLGADFSDVAAAQARLDASLRGGVAVLEQNAAAARDLAEADRLLAVEAKGLADQQERGRLAAQSELAAIKDSEEFTRKFAAAQLETSKAVEALTDDLDRQAATVRGSLITSMNAAAAAYEAEQNSLRESIALGEKRAASQREQAEADRLAALELKGMAEARERSTLAAQSELAAIKDSEEFTRKFEKAQRDTAAAVQALTDDLDRQAALVQGRLVKSLADAAAAYNTAEKEAEQAAQAANRVNGYFEKLAAQRDVLSGAFGTTGVRSIQAIEQEMFKVSQALVTLRAEFAGGGISLRDFERATASAQVRLATLKTEIATIPGQRTAFDSLADSVNGMITKFGALAAAAATVGFAVKPVIDAFISLQSTERILTQITGSAEEAARQIGFLRDTAQKSGQSFSEVSQTYAKFAASALQAGLSTQQVQEAFKQVSLAAGNLGLSSDQAKRALEALSQIASKGTVSMEELRQQLGDALPGVLPLLAKELGLTGKELNKLVESGGLLAADAIPAISRALTQLTPASGVVNGLVAEFNRFKNVVTEAGTLLLEGPLGQGAGTLLTAFSGALRDLSVVAVGASESLRIVGRTVGLIAASLTGGIKGIREFGAEFNKILLDSADKVSSFEDRAYGVTQATVAMSDAAKFAVVPTEAHAAATQAAGQAAATATPQHIAAAAAVTAVGTAAGTASTMLLKLAVDYDANIAAANLAADTAKKLAQAQKDAGDATKGLADLVGSEAASKAAAADASGRYSEALRIQAEAEQTVVNVMVAQRNALEQQAIAEGKLDTARKESLKVLDDKIEKEQAAAEKSKQTAAAAEVQAAAARVAAESLKDNTLRYDELKRAVEGAEAALEAVKDGLITGATTSDDLSRATIRLREAQALLKDSILDTEKALKAYQDQRQADNSVAEAGLKLKLEEQKALERFATLHGLETQALQAKIAQKQIELELARLSAKAKADEATETIRATEQLKAELEQAGLLTDEKRRELDLRIRNAEAKKIEAQAASVATKAIEDEIKALQGLGGAVGKVNDTRAEGRRQAAQDHELTMGEIAAQVAALQALGDAWRAEHEAAKSALQSTKYDAQGFALGADGQRFTAGGNAPRRPGDGRAPSDWIGQGISPSVTQGNAPTETLPFVGTAGRRASTGVMLAVPSAAAPAPASAAARGTNYTVNINFSGNRTSINTASAADAQRLSDFLQQLSDASMRAGG